MADNDHTEGAVGGLTIRLPQVLPVFPLNGVLLLPGGSLPLHVFEPRYRALVDHALGHGRVFGMIQPSELDKLNQHGTPLAGDSGKTAGKGESALYGVGCLGRITAFQEADDGRFMISLTGVCRFNVVEEMDCTTPYRQLRVEYSPFVAHDLHSAAASAPEGEMEQRREKLLPLVKGFLERNGRGDSFGEAEKTDTGELVNALSMISPFSPGEKQALLEARDDMARCDLLISLLEMAAASTGGGDGDKDTTVQ